MIRIGRSALPRAGGRSLFAGGMAACMLAGPALAHLGSFSPADGYQIVQPWVDVSYFNAGQNGANAGGGAYQHIAPDSGLWKVTGNAGGIFPNAAARAAATATAPPYGAVPPGTEPIYIVGDHSPGRTDNSALAFRNSAPAGTGPAIYDYTFDTYDTGGTIPSSVTSGIVGTQFYFAPNPEDPVIPGTTPRDKFAMSFKDGLGNVGLEWGYAADNEMYWRTTSGPWTYTGLYANDGQWDGIRVDIDLTADTVKLDYYNVVTNLWSNLIPAGTPLGTPMNNFTNLGWRLEDNIFTGVGGKNFFDDFTVRIPEPATGALCLLGLALLGKRRSA